MKSKQLTMLRSFLALTAIFACVIQSQLFAAVIKYDMAVQGSIYDSSSWEGGIVPGSNDIVLVQNTATGQSRTLNFTNEVQWAGLYLDAPISKDLSVSLSGDGSLLLGSQGFKTSSGNMKNVNFNIPIYLTADQTWSYNSGTLGVSGNVYFQGYTMTIEGTAKQEIKRNMVGPGNLLMKGSNLNFSNAIDAEDIDVVIDRGYMYSYMNIYDWSDEPRAKSLSVLSDFHFKIYSSSEWRCTTNTIASDIILSNGFFIVTMDRARTPKMFLSAPGLQREHGMFLFRGRELGESLVSNTDTQAVNFIFDNAPALIGDTGGSGSTVPIMEGAIVDPFHNGYGEGFGTYDEDYGIRLLDRDTEYATSIVDGQSTLDNILLDTQGDGSITEIMTEPLTVINSLTMTEYGAAGTCGITVTSAPSATLRINSGMIFANQYMTNTPTTDDSLVLAVSNLDFNGKDGIIYVKETKYTSNGSCNAPFRFRSIPTNISDSGLYFYSASGAYIFFDGDFINTYTGPITLGGRPYVRLEKAIANNAILGTLIIAGATCQNTGNEIADDSDVIIKYGSFTIKSGASNSGNGGFETFRDLTMYGGDYTHGGGGGGNVSMRNATLLGGRMRATRGTLTDISGDMVISGGGYLSLDSNSDSNRSGGKVNIMGDLTISNTLDATGLHPYTPIVMGWSYYRGPAYISLTNKVSVYGNDINPNGAAVTRSYSTDSRTMLAEFRLNDEVEFYIEDGIAEYDFDVDASFADGAVSGKLLKTGDGTLRMTAGTNILSGGIQIDAGRIVVEGGVSNDVSVAADAVIAGNGSIDGDLTFDGGAVFETRMIDDVTVETLNVSGAVTGSGAVAVIVSDEQPEGEWMVMTAESFDADFVSTNPDWSLRKMNSGTELWLTKNTGTLLIIK